MKIGKFNSPAMKMEIRGQRTTKKAKKILNQDKYMMRRITRLETQLCQTNFMRKMTTSLIGKIPTYIVNVVYNDDIG